MAGNVRQNPPRQPQLLPRSRSTTAPRLRHTGSRSATTPLDRSKSATKSRSKSIDIKVDSRSSYNNDNKSISIINPRSSPRPRVNNGIQPYPSAWALSPGRLPPPEPTKEKKKGMMGFLNINVRKKAKEPTEREEAAHRLRIMACRLLQWRFVNARRERAVGRVRSTAERKLFFAWLRINELLNIVADKRILIQRRKQNLILPRILNPQLHLLNQWDPHSKRHLDSVTGLSTALESVCLPVPLINGAEADIDLLHDYICMSTELMAEIEDAVRIFYSKAEEVSEILNELVETLGLEMDGLNELMKTRKILYTLEMHETSLRANLIQATKTEIELPPLSTLRFQSWIHSHQFWPIY